MAQICFTLINIWQLKQQYQLCMWSYTLPLKYANILPHMWFPNACGHNSGIDNDLHRSDYHCKFVHLQCIHCYMYKCNFHQYPHMRLVGGMSQCLLNTHQYLIADIIML